MPVARLLQLFRVVAEAELREAKDRLRYAAMIGWQLGQLMGAERTSFGEWLTTLGLAPEEQERPGDAPGVTRDEALAKAATALKTLKVSGVKELRTG